MNLHIVPCSELPRMGLAPAGGNVNVNVDDAPRGWAVATGQPVQLNGLAWATSVPDRASEFRLGASRLRNSPSDLAFGRDAEPPLGVTENTALVVVVMQLRAVWPSTSADQQKNLGRREHAERRRGEIDPKSMPVTAA